MNTEQLRHFIIAAKHLNFSEAARELYITQPALSHQISALEKELGTKLFHRSTRRVALTKSGTLFLEDAKRMLDMEEAARERIQFADSSSEISLNIAYLLAPCKSFLPAVIHQFRQLFPQVNISLVRMDAHNISDAMPREQYDLYFSLTRDFDQQNRYAYKTIFSDIFCLICREDHPCVRTAKIDFDKIASEPFFMLNPAMGPFMAKQTLQICRANHFQPQLIQYMDSMEEIQFAVESGLGITILPSKNKAFYPSSLAYIPLGGIDARLSIGAAWMSSADNPAIAWFLDLLEKMLEEHPEWISCLP